MRSYAERAVFTAPEVAAWRRAQHFVGLVSDDWGDELRCHELARAVARMLHASLEVGWRCDVHDGQLSGIEHSWIELASASDERGLCRRSILDVYTPGRIPQVQLVDHHFAVAREYLVRPRRTDVDLGVVRRLEREMVRG